MQTTSTDRTTGRPIEAPAPFRQMMNGNAMVDLKEVLGDTIYTRRLRLRRIVEADLPLLLSWSNCQAAFGAYLTPERLTAERLKEQFAAGMFWNRHDKTLLIEKRDPVGPIGTIHYWFKQDRQGCAVVSIKVAAVEERCKGYGTEAQKFLIIQLFEQVGVAQVEMYTDIDNLAQQRCLAKLGFVIDHSLTYDDHQVTRTGHLFRLAREDYQKAGIYRYHYE